MSLFDVIKYPISDPPTRAELDALPFKILIDYTIEVGWAIKDVSYTAINHARGALLRGNARHADIEVLKRLIKEYDVPV